MGKKESKQENSRENLSRRSFLSVLAAGGAGVAATSLLSGCASSDSGSQSGSTETVEWSEEVDIVIAGSGMSLFSALYAHMKGENVLLIEKGSFLGGTASLSGGAVWLPMNPLMVEADSRDDAIELIKIVAEGSSTDELIEAFVDASGEFAAWSIDELEFPWSIPPNETSGWDAYQQVAGYHPGRVLQIDASFKELTGNANDGVTTGGPAIFKWLRSKVEEVALPYKLDTAVTRLITDEVDQVIGVEVQEKNQTYYIKANKAVILATGGYDHDAEMRKNYQRTPLFNAVAVSTNTGDGIKMGLDLGADLAQMQSNWGNGCWLPVDEVVDPETTFYNTFEIFDASVERVKPGSIIVNRFGVRFGDESSNYHTWNRTFEAWDAGSDHFCQMWPGYLIVDATFMQYYPLPLSNGEVGKVPDGAIQADSLEELAEKCGINWENLSWQIEEFNKFAKQGYDPQFHRGENTWDTHIRSGGDSTGRTDLASPCMAPVETSPFVAMTIYPGTIGTKGGLKTNGKAQVLKRDGSIIPRLYAACGGANTPLGEGYPSAGAALGSNVVMGHLAITNAMNEAALGE